MAMALTAYVSIMTPVGDLGRFDAALAERQRRPIIEELLRLWRSADARSGKPE